MNNEQWRELSRRLRRRVIERAHAARCPHVGCAMSCLDIMAVLFQAHLRLALWEQRDVFLLSKAHAHLALNSIRDYYPRGASSGEPLPVWDIEDRVEDAMHSLGHGLGMGQGLAYGFKLQGSSRRVVVLMGDGETQEGSVWEAAQFAARLGMDNLTVIVDNNDLQGYGRPRKICGQKPSAEKWRAFGWQAVTVDGHDHQAVLAALQTHTQGKPLAVIAETVKGKGVSFMEDQLHWHYYIVTDERRQRALEELL